MLARRPQLGGLQLEDLAYIFYNTLKDDKIFSTIVFNSFPSIGFHRNV
jgi:hypothetical protein